MHDRLGAPDMPFLSSEFMEGVIMNVAHQKFYHVNINI